MIEKLTPEESQFIKIGTTVQLEWTLLVYWELHYSLNITITILYFLLVA